MVDMTFVLTDGRRIEVAGEDGLSVMELAVRHNVPGLDGDCGGSMCCGTCHTHVDERWLERLDAVCETEQAILEHVVADARPESRLACQIRLAAHLDGLLVAVPQPPSY